jgi:pancreatic triacylglycerol lipase
VKCYGVYGCFPITPPFTSESRPVNLYPFSPQRLDVRFPVFTKDIRDYPEYIDINDPDSIYNLKLNPSGNIFVIAHGFLEAGDRPWIRKLARLLIEMDSASTVVVVDWRFGSSPPYTQAVANIRLVGAITAHVIQLLHVSILVENRKTVKIQI